MKIGIITSSNATNQTRGVGFYSERLIEALQKTDQIEIGFPKFSRWGFGYQDYDLIHFTYFDPFFLTLPFVFSRPTIVTVHDLTPLAFPKGFPRGLKGEIKWQIQRALLLNSRKVIAVSKQTKSDIVLKTNYPENKVDVVYEAPGTEFKPISQKSILNTITARYNLPAKFILYIGDVNYNKNVSGLIKTYSLVHSKNPNLHLVIVGKVYVEKNVIKEVAEIKSMVSNFGLNDRVHFTGYVPSGDLAGIFNLAVTYVQPSIYEGFCLPVVEALSCGCPVVCGRNSSLPEVGGSAAYYTNTQDPEESSSLILQIVGLSNDKTKKIKELSINQAKKFTWEKTARQTIESYKSIL